MPGLKGCLVAPPPWEAKLAGVFSKAVALGLPNGLLISAVRDEGGMEALAIWPGPGAFDGIKTAADHRAGASGFVAAIAAIEDAYAAAEIWDPRPRLAALSQTFAEGGRKGASPRGAAATAASRLQAAISQVEASARRRGRTDGSDDEVTIRGSGPYGRTFAALRRRGDFPAALVGFGPGTTPAGDDWLAGYLCAADLVSGRGPGYAEAALRNEIIRRLDRTTAAGRSLLTGALAGVPPRYLCALVESLAATEPSAGAAAAVDDEAGWPDAGLVATVESALSHGASSGRDAVDGFLSALLGLGATVEA
jgi:hypothetical protein